MKPKPVEDNPDETIEVRSASDSDEERDVAPNGQPAGHDAPVPPPPVDGSSAADVTMTEAGETDGVIATPTANDVQQMDGQTDPVTTGAAQDTVMEDSPSESQSSATPTSSTASSTEISIPAEPEMITWVPHIYYFIEVFDIEKQIFRVVGSYLSRVEENIMAAVRKHLQWPEDKDFLIWMRDDATTITAISPADDFLMPMRDGICFIVGEKVTKDQYVSTQVEYPAFAINHVVR